MSDEGIVAMMVEEVPSFIFQKISYGNIIVIFVFSFDGNPIRNISDHLVGNHALWSCTTLRSSVE